MAAGLTVDRLHQVALKANDLDASVAFYRDILGLRIIARFDPPGLAFLDIGGTRLMLSTNSSEGTLYFGVADLDEAVVALEGLGVEFIQPPTLIHRDDAGQFGKVGQEEWMAFFRDPGGNTLALVGRR